MVLSPEGDKHFRLMVLGRKRLPQPERHERIWGFVDKLAKSGGEIEVEFREQHYATKTRGERILPAVRPASPPEAGLSEAAEAHYPKSLQREFHGRRFAATDPRLFD